MSTTFSPESILKDLSNLWVQFSDDKGDKNASGVVRACTMTLVATMDEEQDTRDIHEIIAELMHHSPSRAVLLRVTRDQASSDTISARVQAQCWLPFGQRQQICCEQIEITSPVSLLSDVPKLMLSLTVPDLPVILYVRSPRLISNHGFHDLFPLAHKIVIDSGKFEDPETGFSFVRNAHRLGRNIGDLAWTRLTSLRQLISQLCENEACHTHIRSIKTVTILQAPPISLIASQYLGSWFRSALPEAEVIVAPGKQAKITLAGPGLSISVASNNGIVTQNVNGFTRTASLPSLNERDLLREELSFIGPDPVFARCFKVQ